MKTLATLMLVLGLVGFAAAQDLGPVASADLDAPTMGAPIPWSVDHALDGIFERWGNGWFRGRDWSRVNTDIAELWAGLEGIRDGLSPAEFAAANDQINDAVNRVMAAGMN